jgi:hypothetical protein
MQSTALPLLATLASKTICAIESNTYLSTLATEAMGKILAKSHHDTSLIPYGMHIYIS